MEKRKPLGINSNFYLHLTRHHSKLLISRYIKFSCPKKVGIYFFVLISSYKSRLWGCSKWFHGCQNIKWDIFNTASLGMYQMFVFFGKTKPERKQKSIQSHELHLSYHLAILHARPTCERQTVCHDADQQWINLQ